MKKEIKQILDEIEELGYIVKKNGDNVKIIEIYKSIISNRIIQNEVASTTNITTSEKWIKETLKYLKN